MNVTSSQRYTRSRPCPICQGYDQAARGQGVRCSGFLSEDGEWARCTREEHAGALTLDDKTEPAAFVHRLAGDCKCGKQHGPARTYANGSGSSRRIVATYDYLDAQGTLRYQTVRYEPKGFSQRQADGKGGWIWNLQGVERLPYRLPQLLAADPGRWVLIPEGEKDCDRLAEAGFVATCNAMGAGKPVDIYAEYLRDRHVAILPDHDVPGFAHAEAWARALTGIAAAVRVVRLFGDAPTESHGADVSDWLDSGHTVEELKVLVLEGPVWKESAEAAAQPVTDEQPNEEWPEPDLEIYHGLAGRMSVLIDPYVESNQAAVLVQFLVAFGIAAGLHPHSMVGATRHAPALYVGLVGRTSRGRKGTSWDPVERLFQQADPDFARRIMPGIGSGERLVWLVRDPIQDKRGEQTDEGAGDRRLLLQEPELARLLTAINREGSTLSAYLRQAYDGRPLRNEVKTNGSISTVHHIGLVGHSTIEELRDRLSEQQVRNGLANRIAWFLASRAKKLSEPPVFEGPDIEEAAQELASCLGQARIVQRMTRTRAAARLWHDWYIALPDDALGITGAITARAEVQVTRFSIVYALTDGRSQVDVEHLRAAIALWDFSARCVRHIWGAGTGDLIADRIYEELAYGPLTMTQISSELFNRNAAAFVLERAVRLLETRGLVVRERINSGRPGRPPMQVRRVG